MFGFRVLSLKMLQTRSFCGIGRRLLMRYRWVVSDVPTAHYARGSTSRWREKPRERPEQMHHPDDPKAYTEMEITDAMEDLEEFREAEYSTRDQKTANQNITAFKTIERKFFRPPREVNLLTWDAKEQIRYLHQELPEEWTFEKLSQSFPISAHGVKLMLKSSFQPRTVADLIKHDRAVHRAWKQLRAAGKGRLKDGPIVSRYEMLVDDNQLDLLGNAAGVAQLPTSDWRQQLLGSGGVTEERTPGPYESIVADYFKMKSVKDELMSSMALSSEQEQRLADHLLSNRMYLQSITSTQETSDYSTRSEDSINKSKRDSVNKSMQTSSVPMNLSSRQLSEEQANELTIQESPDSSDFNKALQRINLHTDRSADRGEELDARRGGDERRELVHTSPHAYLKYRGSVPVPAEYSSLASQMPVVQHNPDPPKTAKKVEIFSIEDQIRLGIDGTTKLSSNNARNQNSRHWARGNHDYMSDQEIQKLQEENRSWHQPTKNKQWRDRNTSKDHRITTSEDSEPFIYRSDTGYQYPFGRRKHLPKQQISVPKHPRRARNESVMYQSGEDVYDEEGEFLYRVP